MNKFIIKETNKEVSFGDTINFKYENGMYKDNVKLTFTPFILPYLLDWGIVEEKEDTNEEISLGDCIRYLANKNNWPTSKALGFVSKIYATCSSAAIIMIAKAAAVLLDRRYEGHISQAKEIWCVSLVDWDVHKIDVSTIKDFSNFAAFRNKQDALVALSIISDLRNNGGK